MNFNLDINGEGLLVLTFSETVNVTSLDLTQITLENENITSSVTLSGGVKLNGDSHILNIKLSSADHNYLKYYTDLAVDKQTTYIRLGTTSVYDMSGNVVSIAGQPRLIVNVFSPDTTNPRLASFNMDLTANILSLTFTELINVTSFTITEVSLHASNIMYSENYTLTGGAISGPSLTSGHPPVIYISLILNDTNTIKQLRNLAISNTSTYLSIPATAASDNSGNSLVPIYPSSPLRVSIYSPDLIKPRINFFSLDLTTEILRLYIDETIDITSLDISSITLQSSKISNLKSYTLTDSIRITSLDYHIIEVLLSYTDRNQIQLNTQLCTMTTNCYLSFPAHLLTDTNINYIVPVITNSSLNVMPFKADLNRPNFLSSYLNMNNGQLTMSFNEPVDVSTLDISQITLQSAPGNLTNQSNYVILTPGAPPSFTSTSSSNGVSITIYLGSNDLIALQNNTDIATLSSNIYIAFDSSLIMDMNLNPIIAMPHINASQIAFIPDSTGPNLLSFFINLNSGFLAMTFDEVVNVDSLNTGRVIIHSTNESDTINIHQVLDSQTPPTNVIIIILYPGPVIIVYIYLTKADLDSIKLKTDIATRINNTYLQLLSGAITDTANIGK